VKKVRICPFSQATEILDVFPLFGTIRLIEWRLIDRLAPVGTSQQKSITPLRSTPYGWRRYGVFLFQQDVSSFWSLHRDLQSINVRNPARGGVAGWSAGCQRLGDVAVRQVSP
jgi:hypothetical protein